MPPMSGEPSVSVTVPSGVDQRHSSGRAGVVAPEARRDAAPPALAVLGRGVVRVGLGCLEGLDVADLGSQRAGGTAGAFLGAVHQAQVDSVDAEFFGQFIQRDFHAVRRSRGAGRAIRSSLGPVHDDVVSLDVGVGDIVRGEHAVGRSRYRGTGERAGLKDKVDLGGGDFAVVGRADPTGNLGT